MMKKILSLVALFFLFILSNPALAADYYVDGADGDDAGNSCTMPNAACKTINGALGKVAEGDTVKIAPWKDPYQETVLIPYDNIILEGTGQKAGGVVIGSGLQNVTKNATVRNLSIRNEAGAGVLNAGDMLLEKVIVTGKSPYCGGAIRTMNTWQGYPTLLTLKDSTVTDSATMDNGAGICASAKMIIMNSTISGNEAIGDPSYPDVTGMGGAVYVWGGDVRIYNSTITRNKAKSQGGALAIAANYGYALRLNNSILSDNTVNQQEQNCGAGGIITGGGFNLEKGSSCADPNIPSLFALYSDPGLDALKDNGGATPTHALLAGSLAIDAGNPDGCQGDGNFVLDGDQRGQIRVGICDLGAFEYVPPGWQPPTSPGTPGTGVPAVQPAPAQPSALDNPATTPQEPPQVANKFGPTDGKGGCSLHASASVAGNFWLLTAAVLAACFLRFRKINPRT